MVDAGEARRLWLRLFFKLKLSKQQDQFDEENEEDETGDLDEIRSSEAWKEATDTDFFDRLVFFLHAEVTASPMFRWLQFLMLL